MPFRSMQQIRYMFKNHPSIAKRWASKYGVPSKLPEKVKKKRKVVMGDKEFTREHVKLVRILKSGSKAERASEAKRQAKEL